MLSVQTRICTMSVPAIENPPVQEEMEDGEIEDGEESEEEVIIEEPAVVSEKNAQESASDAYMNETAVPGQEAYSNYAEATELKQQSVIDGALAYGNEENDAEDYDVSSMTSEERKRFHKKHQRKRRKHKDSKEREIRSLEKKEKRRKRKMNTTEDAHEENGGSLSPHGKKRRKRKKHSRDHRDSTTPESNASDENKNSASHSYRNNTYYAADGKQRISDMVDYDDGYVEKEESYTSATIHSQHKSYSNTSNNNSGGYYSPSATQGYQNDANYDSQSESESDFEAQLAEYQSYKTKKTHDDEYGDDYYPAEVGKHRQPGRYSSPSSSRRSGRRGQNSDTRNQAGSMPRNQRPKRSRWENRSNSVKILSEEREIPSSSRREKRMDDRGNQQYGDHSDYNESSRRLCRYFVEGACNKGSECTFSHDMESQPYKTQQQQKQYNHQTPQTRAKRRDLCKFYLAGHCHHGDNCTYMHSEYPCKYHHTGASCYAGDNCRFSHAPATEETKEIIESLKDVYSGVDDSWEINELAKAGVKALSKPPPGVGLLPTPSLPPTNSMGGIPSLFDIKVEPSADLQRRIDEKMELKIERKIQEFDTACALLQLQSSVTSLSMTDESEGTADAGLERQQQGFSQYKPKQGKPFPNINLTLNKQGLLPTPIAIAPIIPLGDNKRDSDGFYDNFYESDYNLENTDVKKTPAHDRKKTSTDEDMIKTDEEDFIRIDTGTSATEEDNTDESNIKAPDFLPATQKALFMRIHHKRPSSESDKGADGAKSKKEKESDGWTYSSDDEERPTSSVPGVIKIDGDVATKASTPSVESILKMITSKQGGSSAIVDTNLLSKVASVINMSTMPGLSSSEHYNPAVNAATYNPAQVKASPRHSSSHGTHRERKISGSSSTSPGHASSKHGHHHQPIRRRLSTQELSKEPTIIPLVAKQSGGLIHSAHPDPRMSLSRLLGLKVTRYSASLPRFSKDLILPGSGKMIGLKITLSSDDSKSTKRDPRLGRKDPRLQKSSDPRLKGRTMAKFANTTPSTDTVARPAVPAKPSALITKSSAVIPSLPELDLDLAHISNRMKENTEPVAMSTSPPSKTTTSYSLPPHLKLPRLMKAPVSITSTESVASSSPSHETPSVPPPTLAPYDPRYMSSGTTNTTAPTLTMNPAPYDPRVLSGNLALPTGELKKRTIQLPKLTPAPSYKPSDHSENLDTTNGHTVVSEKIPEGDQGDF